MLSWFIIIKQKYISYKTFFIILKRDLRKFLCILWLDTFWDPTLIGFNNVDELMGWRPAAYLLVPDFMKIDDLITWSCLFKRQSVGNSYWHISTGWLWCHCSICGRAYWIVFFNIAPRKVWDTYLSLETACPDWRFLGYTQSP